MRKKAPVLAAAMCAVCVGVPACAVELRGTTSVSITSDTAATAKNIAMAEARRQIISDTLRQYANADQLSALIASASGNDLTNLISSTGIEGEQTSATTYSANITMTINSDVARGWLTQNNVQNWIPDGGTTNNFIALITMSDSVAQWMEIKRIARELGADISTKYIMGNQVTAEIPVSLRGRLTIALRDAGWRYAADGDVLKIWK